VYVETPCRESSLVLFALCRPLPTIIALPIPPQRSSRKRQRSGSVSGTDQDEPAINDIELKSVTLPFAAEIINTNIWLEIRDDLPIKYPFPVHT
jgi:hypothetical protein